MNNDEMEFRDWLRREMALRGYGQAELSRLSKVPQPTIQRILSGETPDPRGSTIDKIKGVLGEQAEDADLVAAINRFVGAYRNLTDEGRVFVEHAITAASRTYIREDKRNHALAAIIERRKKN